MATDGEKAIVRVGLAVIMIDGEGDLSFNDETVTNQAVENHKKWIDAAQYLGCHSIRVNLFGEENAEDREAEAAPENAAARRDRGRSLELSGDLEPRHQPAS